MLGERGTKSVTQNAWIRALTSSFVKPWEGRAGRTGGLFGERIGERAEVLHRLNSDQTGGDSKPTIFSKLKLKRS